MSGNSKAQALAYAQNASDKQSTTASQASQQPGPGQKGGASQGGGQNNQQMYQLDPDMIGAIKIKDGLFIGDELASQDIEFVIANKVTHIINCAGKQIMNHWEPIGVAYLAFYWLDQDNQVVLDAKDEASNAIFDFIEEAVEQTESVLVHSVRGQSRATCTLAAYIMRKYRWSLLKSLEFLNSRRPDLEIRATFIHQLSAYEQRLQKKFKEEKFTSGWEDLSEQQPYITSEELILRNTFINARMGPLADFNRGMKNGAQKKRYAIRWIDEIDKDRAGKKDGLKMNDFKDDLLKKKKIDKIEIHRQKQAANIRGTLKDRKFTLAFITGVESMDKHVLFGGSQTVRASSQRETKGAWGQKQQVKKKKDDHQRGNSEASKKQTNQHTGIDKDSQNRQPSNRFSVPSDFQSSQAADPIQKKVNMSKSKSAPAKSLLQTPAPEQKTDSQKQIATPDMFYKKADNIEIEGEMEDHEGAGVIVGEKKLMTGVGAQTIGNNLVDINDDEEDDQILSAIQVDDDEGDSCSDETSKVMLKNSGKDGQSAAEMRNRASSGSKNLRNSRSERTRSRGGSGGSRGSRTGQRINTKPTAKDQLATAGQSPNSTNIIAFTERTDNLEVNKQKNKVVSGRNQQQSSQSKEDNKSSEDKGVLRRSNNFMSVPANGSNERVRENKTETGASQTQNISQRDGQTGAPVIQQQQPQNITNIINNNNINNFIINDPKTVAQLQAGLIPTNTTQAASQSSQPSSNSTAVAPATGQTQVNPRASGSSQQRASQSQVYTQQQTNHPSNQTTAAPSQPSSTPATRESYTHNGRSESSRVASTTNKIDGGAGSQIKSGASSGRVVKVRQGSQGNNGGQAMIVLNQHGINYNQGPSYHVKQQQQSQYQRDGLGRHQRGGSDAQIVETNQVNQQIQGSRTGHKRATSHQYQRGPGSLSNQRNGGRNNNADNSQNAMNENANGHGQSDGTYGQPGSNSYLNHTYNQQNQKGSGNHPMNTAPASGKPQVASLVQKEMAKRHESPRSRRQIVGQFGPGGQQQTSSQGHAAALGGKKYSHQPAMNYHGQDHFDMTGAVNGIGSVGMGINMQDINKFFVNDNRSNSHANFQSGQNSKIGNYQYRQNQTQQQIKFGRGASATAQHPKTPQNISSSQGVNFGVDASGLHSVPNSAMGNQGNMASSQHQQNQNMFNRTGPIKIQNRLHDVNASEDAKNHLNNTQNLGGGRDGPGHKKNKTMVNNGSRFNESLNISDGQVSIQDAGQPQPSHGQKVMYATGVRFGNPNGQVTKVKKQLNIVNSSGGQDHHGANIISTSGGHKNLAWVAHRHSSVKSRAQQKQQQSTGSDPNIFNKQNHAHQSGVRPGTAPKQALFNNFADSGQIQTISGGAHFGGGPSTNMHHQRKGSTGQDRPLSPYTKVFHQSGSNSNSGNAVSYKRRAHSRRDAPAQQMQNLISPTQTNQQRQRPGSTTFHLQFQPQTTGGSSNHFRRSQSPASNTGAHRTHKTIYYSQPQSAPMGSAAVSTMASQQHTASNQGHHIPGGNNSGNILSPYQRMQGVKRVARR